MFFAPGRHIFIDLHLNVSHRSEQPHCFFDEERNCIQEVGNGVQFEWGMTTIGTEFAMNN
jgi:hypothetical protein